MKKTNLVASLVGAAAIALLSQAAYAQDPSAPKTRAEVKADKARTPAVVNSSSEGSGSSPGASKSGTTRAAVKADSKKPTPLATLNSEAETGAATAGPNKSTKTRAEVKAESAGAKVPAGDKLPGQK